MIVRAGLLVGGVLALGAAIPLAAQAAALPDTAAISAADLRRHVAAIAHDSMGGRATPSRGLERTAEYVAAQLEQLGLLPAGDAMRATRRMLGVEVLSDTIPWIHRYELPGAKRLSAELSQLTFTVQLRERGENLLTDEGKPAQRQAVVFLQGPHGWARVAADSVPQDGSGRVWRYDTQGELRVFAGRQTAASARAFKAGDHAVLYVPPADAASAEQRAVVDAFRANTNVVVVSNEDSATFVRRRDSANARPAVVVEKSMEGSGGVVHWAAHVWPGAVAGLLKAGGVDLERLRADTTPRVLSIPDAGVVFHARSAYAPYDTAFGQNVIGLLPGSDSARRNEYVIVAAHMDHAGPGPGANDNASGVAGLLALAEAFTRPDARPKRSMLFAATSGGADGAESWGANELIEAFGVSFDIPVAAVLSLDMLGRAPKDSLFVNGLSEIDYVPRIDWIAAQHPELGVTLVDGGTVAHRLTDHGAFLARGMPTLLFYGGTHGDDEADDGVDAIDAEQEARMLKLIYHVAAEMTRSTRWPRFNRTGRENRRRWLGE